MRPAASVQGVDGNDNRIMPSREDEKKVIPSVFEEITVINSTLSKGLQESQELVGWTIAARAPRERLGLA